MVQVVTTPVLAQSIRPATVTQSPPHPPVGAGAPLSLLPVEKFRAALASSSACPEPGYVVNTETGRWHSVDCKRRRCRYCGPARWKPYVQAVFASGWGKRGKDTLRTVDYSRDRFVLLTAPGDAGADWNDGASKRWTVFYEHLRRRMPGRVAAQLAYFKVGELQERGAVHYHAYLRGIGFLPVATLRECALAAGFGPFVGIKRIEARKGGLKGALAYLAKYLLKATGVEAWGLKQHVMTHCHGWRREWEPKAAGNGLLWRYCLSELEAFGVWAAATGELVGRELRLSRGLEWSG